MLPKRLKFYQAYDIGFSGMAADYTNQYRLAGLGNGGASTGASAVDYTFGILGMGLSAYQTAAVANNTAANASAQQQISVQSQTAALMTAFVTADGVRDQAAKDCDKEVRKLDVLKNKLDIAENIDTKLADNETAMNALANVSGNSAYETYVQDCKNLETLKTAQTTINDLKAKNVTLEATKSANAPENRPTNFKATIEDVGTMIGGSPGAAKAVPVQKIELEGSAASPMGNAEATIVGKKDLFSDAIPDPSYPTDPTKMRLVHNPSRYQAALTTAKGLDAAAKKAEDMRIAHDEAENQINANNVKISAQEGICANISIDGSSEGTVDEKVASLQTKVTASGQTAIGTTTFASRKSAEDLLTKEKGELQQVKDKIDAKDSKYIEELQEKVDAQKEVCKTKIEALKTANEKYTAAKEKYDKFVETVNNAQTASASVDATKQRKKSVSDFNLFKPKTWGKNSDERTANNSYRQAREFFQQQQQTLAQTYGFTSFAAAQSIIDTHEASSVIQGNVATTDPLVAKYLDYSVD